MPSIHQALAQFEGESWYDRQLYLDEVCGVTDIETEFDPTDYGTDLETADDIIISGILATLPSTSATSTSSAASSSLTASASSSTSASASSSSSSALAPSASASASSSTSASSSLSSASAPSASASASSSDERPVKRARQ